MAEVRIPLERFKSLSFPSICAATGLPAAEMFSFRFGNVVGGLPLHSSTARLVRRHQSTTRALAALTLFVFLLAVTLKSPILGFGAFGMAIIVLAEFAVIHKRLPRGIVDDKELHLLNVHTAFVDALNQPVNTHKCTGCPSVNTCSDDKIEACDGAGRQFANNGKRVL